MKRWLSFYCAALFGFCAAAAPLFENGKTQWRIVLPDNAGTELKYAASELAATLKKVSGADFAIQTTAGKEFNIFLGTPETSPEVAKLARNFKLPADKAIESVAVYTVGNDQLSNLNQLQHTQK